ncbi:MAG: hypothetical protein H0X67_12650, partial [Acidobacteria bacterium]|nr:hypothetical protein [Acidobacteriota bacterium]
MLDALDPDGCRAHVSVQGLHRFYTRREEVVASWMTREDRELAIADNVGYVTGGVAAVRRDYPVGAPLVCVGFSQGVAMAYRAWASGIGATGLIVLAGDVSPGVRSRASVLPPTLIGRGTKDEWYSSSKLQADLGVLEGGVVRVETVEFDGGHAWDEAMVQEARGFLSRLVATEPGRPAAHLTRLVEHKKDVVILLDSVTRLARADNTIVPPSGSVRLRPDLTGAEIPPDAMCVGVLRSRTHVSSLAGRGACRVNVLERLHVHAHVPLLLCRRSARLCRRLGVALFPRDEHAGDGHR